MKASSGRDSNMDRGGGGRIKIRLIAIDTRDSMREIRNMGTENLCGSQALFIKETISWTSVRVTVRCTLWTAQSTKVIG